MMLIIIVTETYLLGFPVTLTMFADYRVPAVLREMNILKYAESLSHK